MQVRTTVSPRLPRLAVVVLVAVLGAAALTACSDRVRRTPSRAASPASALSTVLTAKERRLVLSVARDTATTMRPHARAPFSRPAWSSNLNRVVAAVGSLRDAAAWKRPGMPWQFSDPREAHYPVLVVQIYGNLGLFRLKPPEQPGVSPSVVKYDIPELTYVISTLDGAHLSAVQGNALPTLAPAGTLFAR